MTKLSSCPECRAFLPLDASSCPCCQRSVSRRRRLPAPVRALLAVGGGGLLSVTLSACYGAPCAGSECDFSYCDDPALDVDGDGYCGQWDCDETDASANYYTGCADAGPSEDDAGSDDAGLTSDGGLVGDGGIEGDGGFVSDGGSEPDAAVGDAGL